MAQRDPVADISAQFGGLGIGSYRVKNEYKKIMKQLKDDFEEILRDQRNQVDGSLKQEISGQKIPLMYIVNTLKYAWQQHELYIEQMPSDVTVLFVGMNPAPDTPSGIPFGDEKMILKLFGIDISKEKLDGIPPILKSKQYVDQYGKSRDCVSGRRFWKFMNRPVADTDQVRKQSFVMNCSPLLFTGRTEKWKGPKEKAYQKNISLNDLKYYNNQSVRNLMKKSEDALKRAINLLKPKLIVAFGRHVEERLKKLGFSTCVVRVTHPSPLVDGQGDNTADPDTGDNKWIAKVEEELKKNYRWNELMRANQNSISH